jgi:glycosyltransferase involved in cell wall biosynthesis
MKPRISIALATYNGGRYLRDQLDSFANQSLLPDELVACDDGSSDNTLAILEDFAATAPFSVHIHRNERNLGYPANFGKALSLTAGDLVFLSDQDDVWLPEKLAVFARHARAAPDAQLFVCDALLCDAALRTGIRISENVRRMGARRDQINAGCCTAVRRRLISLALPLAHPELSHDDWLHGLAGAIGQRIYIDRPLQLFRRHGANASAGAFFALQGITLASRLRSMVEDSLRDPVPPWQRGLAHFEHLRARLGERRAELENLIGKVGAQAALDAIDAEMASVRARISLVRRARPGRILDVLKHYRSGGYVRHRAHVSALKDIISPTSPTVTA